VAGAEGFVLPVETTGKYKMTFQVIAIVMLILDQALAPPLQDLYVPGTVCLYTALVLGLYSGARYLATFWREIASRGL
jgi:phosphatidylglycerophosphate synthase